MADKTSSYKTLFLNTLIFALGSFGSKLLVLVLVPLYTAALTPEQYGTVDLIAQTANILIPIFTLTISEAALRFGLETKWQCDRQQIYTICLRVMAVGLIAMSGIFPLLARLDYLDGFGIMLYIYVWTSSLRQINMTFTRAVEKVKLFAVDGILCTLTMLLLNILFLLKFKWGIEGYLLAIILSDAFSSVFLFTVGKLWRYITFGKVDKSLLRSMISYAAPMMPATVLWIVTSISDHFIVKYFHGEYLNGILVIAYKIPTILTTVFTMFSQAWNMSAITENNSSEREDFYTRIFSLNQSFMYVLSAGILMLIKPITRVWVDAAYFESYKYSPILTIATIFTCFNVFLGSVYIAQKKTKHTFYTSLAAGVINIALNLALIPRFGIYGAAIATLCAYFAVFFYRLYDTRRYIHFGFSMPKLLINTALLGAMAAINVMELPGFVMYTALAALFCAVLAINLRELLRIAVFIIPKKIKSKIGFLSKLENKLSNQQSIQERKQ